MGLGLCDALRERLEQSHNGAGAAGSAQEAGRERPHSEDVQL